MLHYQAHGEVTLQNAINTGKAEATGGGRGNGRKPTADGRPAAPGQANTAQPEKQNKTKNRKIMK